MFCSQCGAPMGDNDKFCGVCGAPNAGAAGPAPQGQPQPQQFVPQPPVANAPKGCVAQAFEDMTKTPGVLQRVCQIAFLPALVSAIVFDIGASTGGTDILAMILKRRTTLEIGRALLLVDIGIVTIAAFLYGPRVGLYCVLGLFAKTLVVDKAIESIHLRKVCTVICSEPLKVEEFIVKHLNRTATISRGYGAFSGKCVTVIMSVLSRREAVQLRRYAREVDPGAFITIVDSSEIVGKGFRGTN